MLSLRVYDNKHEKMLFMDDMKDMRFGDVMSSDGLEVGSGEYTADGTEIYQGDIINGEVDSDLAEYLERDGFNANIRAKEIKLNPKSLLFYVELSGNDKTRSCALQCINKIRVVGNIHENHKVNTIEETIAEEVAALTKPVGFESELGGLIPLGENITTAWAYPLRTHLGDERFGELNKLGRIEVIDRSRYPVQWAFIAKELSKEEAIEMAVKKYGDITKIGFGPRGGFKWVDYGVYNIMKDTGARFYNPMFLPEGVDYKTDKRAVPEY